MTAIDIIKLSKRYKDNTAVDELSLSVKKGELFGLLGMNGAGKTSTIKMLSCLLKPTNGDAVLLGDSIVSKPYAVKEKINISPEETAIARNLTVHENLELIAKIYGIESTALQAKVEEMLSTFNLLQVAAKKAKTLSGGMQRRLSIAMALISNPEILFLDEPTLGLDVLARRELWSAIKKLKGRITIILTTHYMEEAEALADRIGIMSQGKLMAVGTATDLISQTGVNTLEDAFINIATQTGVSS